MKFESLEKLFDLEELKRLLQKFFSHLNASSMIWNEKGELLFVDYITPFCREIYSKIPEECEKDRKKRFNKALILKKPFLHTCFAGKLNYVIPLTYEKGKELYFLGIAGG